MQKAQAASGQKGMYCGFAPVLLHATLARGLQLTYSEHLMRGKIKP